MFRKIRNFFFSAFREIFIYHHNSLNFRAKIFALLIAASDNKGDCCYAAVEISGAKIYKDETRVNALVLATKELVEKVHSDNGLNIDHLVDDIVEELKLFARYADKINIDLLEPIVSCSHNKDTKAYQASILRFLTSAKEEYTKPKA